MRVTLDEAVIFDGEIRKAPGDLTSKEQAAEVVLFCTDEAVLRTIEANDLVLSGEDSTADFVKEVRRQLDACRPSTAERERQGSTNAPMLRPRLASKPAQTYAELQNLPADASPGQRPRTAAVQRRKERLGGEASPLSSIDLLMKDLSIDSSSSSLHLASQSQSQGEGPKIPLTFPREDAFEFHC